MEIKTYSINSRSNIISDLRAIFDNAIDWDDIDDTSGVTYTYGNATLKFEWFGGSYAMEYTISTGSVKNKIVGGNSTTATHVGIIVCKTESSLAVIMQSYLTVDALPSSDFAHQDRLMFVLTKHRNAITGSEEKGIVNVSYYNSSENNINVSSAEDKNIFYEKYSLNSNAVKTVLYDATTKNSQCYCPHVFIPKYSNVGEANAVVDVGGKTYYMMAGGLYVLDD